MNTCSTPYRRIDSICFSYKLLDNIQNDVFVSPRNTNRLWETQEQDRKSFTSTINRNKIGKYCNGTEKFQFTLDLLAWIKVKCKKGTGKGYHPSIHRSKPFIRTNQKKGSSHESLLGEIVLVRILLFHRSIRKFQWTPVLYLSMQEPPFIYVPSSRFT